MRIHKSGVVSSSLLRFTVASVIALAGMQAAAQVSGSVSIVSDYRYRGVSLSNGHPEPQAQIGYDGKGGWYVGGFASGVDLKGGKTSHTQLLAYAGYSGRRPSGIAWEAGAVTSIFLHAAGYNYLEGFAGFATDNISGRLYFSPDYFGEHARTLYAELNGSHQLWQRLHLLGHIGFLHVFPTAARFASYPTDRSDISLGVSASVADLAIRLTWVAGNRNNEEPQLYGNQKSQAWVLNVSASF